MSSVRLYSTPSSRVAKPMVPVTRKMLHERTCEIARLAGRTAPYVTQDDYEHAKRELTGDPYALIMDTTIDNGMFYPTAPTLTDPIHPLENNPQSIGHTRDVTPTSRIFWGGDNPLAGVT